MSALSHCLVGHGEAILSRVHTLAKGHLFAGTAGFLLHKISVINPIVGHQLRLKLCRKSFTRDLLGGNDRSIECLIHRLRVYVERIVMVCYTTDEL